MSEGANVAESRSIILARDGKPFGTENAASEVMHKKGYTFDTHEIIAYSGGFAIKEKKQESKPVAVAFSPPAATSNQRYFRVRFQERTDKSQTLDVELGLNGDVLLIKRGVPVVLPEGFLNVARDAKYPKHDYTPGAERKNTTWIVTYPFDNLGEATEAEYLEMRYGAGAAEVGALKSR